MKSSQPSGHTFAVAGISNREFLDRYAQAGRVGLSGGATWVDWAICRAERHLDDRRRWGTWSHAFLFEGKRCDGHHWVIESDLQIHHKHIQLGVQENRVSKYFDESLYSNLAVLDFGLSDAQVAGVLTEALDLVAGHTEYSLRELFGTLLALQNPAFRSRSNLLARARSVYCSALVRHLFLKAGLDLAAGVDVKNTTPEDVARTSLANTSWVLQRWSPRSKLAEFGNRLRRRVRAQIRRVQRKRRSSI